MREKLFDWAGKILTAVFLWLIVIRPLCFYVLLTVGFPPVIGNLISARALREYAAAAHPAWQALGYWAGWNPVSGEFYLSFSDGPERRFLSYDFSSGMVRDT